MEQVGAAFAPGDEVYSGEDEGDGQCVGGREAADAGADGHDCGHDGLYVIIHCSQRRPQMPLTNRQEQVAEECRTDHNAGRPI